MRILLTGSDGFTGRHFSRLAAQAGHEVVALQADLRQAQAVQREIMDLEFDAVLHLAAVAFVGHEDPLDFYRVNVMGTLHLLQALQGRAADAAHSGRSPLRQVVLASSANVYGNCEASPIGEGQIPAPVNHYAASKLAMEHLALATAAELPLRLVRPFNYTGAGQSPSFVIPKIVAHFQRREPVLRLGNLQVQREYNDVRQVCAAYLRLLQLPHPPQAAERVVNVCSGVMHNLQAVLDLAARLSGHELQVIGDPALMRRQEVHRLCGDPSRLHALVGPMPTMALEDTLRWMLQD